MEAHKHFHYNEPMHREDTIKNLTTLIDSWKGSVFTAHRESAHIGWNIMKSYVDCSASIRLLLDAGDTHDADVRTLIRRQYEMVTLLAWLLIDFANNVKSWRANAANFHLGAIRTANAQAQVPAADREVLQNIVDADFDNVKLKQRAQAIDKHYGDYFGDSFLRLYGVIYSGLSADAHCEPQSFAADRSESTSWLIYLHHLRGLFDRAMKLVDDVNTPQAVPPGEPA